ncbi:MAG TPA: glycosyltransferase [Gemmataceae bacterium]|nr:glycosyltransferase [Gemmataceae bacterium]
MIAATAARATTSRRIIVRNLLWNWSGRVMPIALGFFLAPFLVHRLGDHTYGLWAVIASLTGYFGLLDLGTRTSVGRYLAFYRTKKDFEGVNSILNTSAAFLCGAGLLALAGTAAVEMFFVKLFHVHPAEEQSTRLALLLVGVNMALTLPCTLFDATLWAFQRFDKLNLAEMVSTIVRATLTFWWIALGHGLVALAIITIIGTLVSGILKAWMTFREEPALRLAWRYCSRKAGLTLFNYGFWRCLMALCNLGITRFNPLLIGSWLSPVLVVPYALATRLLNYAAQVLVGTRGVLTPAATALHAEDKPEWQRRFMIEAGKYTSAAACFFLVGFVLLGGPFLALWIRPEFVYAGNLLAVLMVGEFLPFSLAGTNSMLLGMARHKTLALLGVVELAVGLPLGIALIGRHGLLGVCVAQALAAATCRGLGVMVYACRLINLPVRSYLAQTLLPASLTALPSAALLGGLLRWRTPASWLGFFAFAGLYALCFLACAALVLGRGRWRRSHRSKHLSDDVQGTPSAVSDPENPRMAEPLVSVVIPTYNYARFVTEAVESALAQTYPNIEIIVVDDGSTDDTRERLDRYRGRLRYIYQPNQGLSSARNTGIAHAKGEWVALLDSDDIWHPQKLEIQMRRAAEAPEVGLIASGHTSHRHDLDKLQPDLDAPLTAVSLEDLALRCRFGPSGVVARRICFDRVGLFDTSLRSAEDRDMWVRIASQFPVAKVASPLWWYRNHPGCMRHVADRMEHNELRVLEKAFADIDALRSQPLLRRKVHSYALFISACRYSNSRGHRTALGRLVRSMALWPVPYRRAEVRCSFIRPKMFLTELLRLARVRRPHEVSLPPRPVNGHATADVDEGVCAAESQ